VLFWATKSSAALPSVRDEQLAGIDPTLRSWLATAHSPDLGERMNAASR
jgi:hypothetical protein